MEQNSSSSTGKQTPGSKIPGTRPPSTGTMRLNGDGARSVGTRPTHSPKK